MLFKCCTQYASKFGKFSSSSSFFYNPTDVGNLISGSSAFLKSSLYIWNFSVHILLKPSLKNFPEFVVVHTKALAWSIMQLLLLQLSHFSCVRLCATPEMAAHHAPPPLGFSRQEHWSGLPFPSPMHESAWKWKVKMKSLSRVRLFATPWTAAYQAPPPMGFSRQEYWSGVPLPSPNLKPR